MPASTTRTRTPSSANVTVGIPAGMRTSREKGVFTLRVETIRRIPVLHSIPRPRARPTGRRRVARRRAENETPDAGRLPRMLEGVNEFAAWPADVTRRLADTVGEPEAVEPLGGMSGSEVYLVRGARDSVVLKVSAGPREARFYTR